MIQARSVAAVRGKVFLVGAGPGDPQLLTLKGKRCLEAADAILYDELVNAALLVHARQNCALIYVGKKPGGHCAEQTAIEALLIEHARAGKKVVRLKGGDPFVFGRGGEEVQALRRAGIPFEIVPGISAAIAVPAYAGIPVTHRSCASSMAIVTGHRAKEGDIRWAELLRSVDTLIVLMGARNLRALMQQLLQSGCAPTRPVALIQSGTTPLQKSAIGTVATAADLAAAEKFRSPMVIVVGDVVRLAATFAWFPEGLSLYDASKNAMNSF